MTPKMRAAVHLRGGTDGIRLESVPVPVPGEGDALVRLDHAALNRHDLFVIDAREHAEAPLILGSDGHGTLETPVEGLTVGDRVIVNPCLGWSDPEQLPLVPEVLGDPRYARAAAAVAADIRALPPVDAAADVLRELS